MSTTTSCVRKRERTSPPYSVAVEKFHWESIKKERQNHIKRTEQIKQLMSFQNGYNALLKCRADPLAGKSPVTILNILEVFEMSTPPSTNHGFDTCDISNWDEETTNGKY